MSTTSDVPLMGFPLSDTSFTSAFLNYITRYGAADSLVGKIYRIDPDTGKTVAFSALPDLVRDVRRRLSLKRIDKSSVVASVCGNSIDVLLAYLAAIELGLIIAPVNPASKQYEIEKYLTTCNVQYVLTEGDYAKKMDEILQQSKHSVVSTLTLEELTEAQHDEPSTEPEESFESAAIGRDTAFIFFSSGTTGPPKAIRHSHRSLLAHLCQLISAMNANSPTYTFPLSYLGDRIHGVLPYFHAGGLLTVFCMLFQGATVVINRKWNKERFLQVVQDYKITTINIVPPILEFLAKHPLVSSFDLSSLRTVYVGAAKCDENLRCVRDRLPKLQEIVQLFGMTETGMLIFVTPIGYSILSSVGRAMPGVKAKVVNENGEQVAPNEVGELLLQSPTMMQGYLVSSTITKKSFHGLILSCFIIPLDKWFHTGDLSYIDDDGFVYIVGRTKDMIKVRAWQVNPYEIEEAIKANVAGVHDCAVIGVNDEIDGQRPKAFIVGHVKPEEVIEFVRSRFISYKHLCAVEIVDVIPRTPSGKVMRSVLAGQEDDVTSL